MENRSVKPSAPLVICPLEDGEGELYTCSTQKAVKAAMGIIEQKYPDAKYEMHLHEGWGIFGLISLPRRTIITLLNKLMTRSLDFGYVGPKKDNIFNKNGTRVFDVKITVNDYSYRDEAWVQVDLKTKDDNNTDDSIDDLINKGIKV